MSRVYQLDRLCQDLHFAARGFRANPNVTLTIVLSLALGIGASCAMFSVIYGVLINPYLYKDARRIIVPTFAEPDSDDRRPTLYYTPADFLEMQASKKTFQSIILTSSDAEVTDSSTPANINILRASANFFDFFGVPAVLGRTFAPADVPNQANPPDVAVIGYKLWLTQFNGRRDVVGKDLKMRGRAYKILGVMPARFGWFDTDAFIPESVRPSSQSSVWLFMRLQPAVSLASADTELQSFTERFAKRNPSRYPRLPFQTRAVPLQDWLLGKFPGKLWILMTASGLLLLIACANVSVLLLSRSHARRQEISMRVALGANPARILQQLLTESLLLALAGCLLGILLAWYGVPAVLTLLPETSLPHESLVSLNLHVLAFTVLVSFATGVLSGLAPALGLLRSTIYSVVQSGNRASDGTHSPLNTRTFMVLAEVALTTMLLSGAAAGLRNLTQLYHADLGYNPKDVAVVDLGPLHNGSQTLEAREAFSQRIAATLRAMPGIQSVAEAGDAVPPSLELESTVSVAGSSHKASTVSVGLVDSEYFNTLQTPLLTGRVFSSSEVQQRAHVAVVNLAFARLLKQQAFDPIGTQLVSQGFTMKDEGISTPVKQVSSFKIIGVAATIENQAMQQPSTPAVYLPYTLRLAGSPMFLVRTKGSPYRFEKSIQRQVRAFELANQPVPEFDDLQHILKIKALSDPQSGATLLTIFASVATALAAIGLFSVVSFSVGQRNKEIAIRMALGAQHGHVVALFLKSTLAVMLTGITAGLLISSVLGRALAFYEQGWHPEDPLTLLSVPVLLLFVGFLATFVPIKRALSVSPDRALRNQ